MTAPALAPLALSLTHRIRLERIAGALEAVEIMVREALANLDGPKPIGYPEAAAYLERLAVGFTRTQARLSDLTRDCP